MDIETWIVNPDFAASGIKWMKAPPNNAPVVKLTKYIKIFSNLSCLIEMVIIPIKEIRLTIITLIIV